MKILIISLSVLVIFTLCDSQKPDRCDLAVRCSDKEEPVWTTTNNKTCEVFRNGCYLATENCNRKNRNLTESQNIGKEKCQKLCKTPCAISSNNSKPICGYYNKEMRNFTSECQMNNLNCATGKTFSLFREGSCPLKP